MKRKILCLFFVLLLSFGSFGANDSSTGFDTKSLTEDFLIVVNAENPEIAVCGLEKNADERCFPASTTKILTCIIAIEEGELDQKIDVPAPADSDRVAGTTMGLEKKEVFTLRDLLYGMMLPSGNDAAIAIAVGLYGSIDAFADRMNEKASEIGMQHSHFVTPNGLHNENHYSTARDMAILSAYAMRNETFRTIVATPEYTAVSSAGRRIKLRSTNRYLRNYTSSDYTPKSVLWSDAIGIKTGETNYAGKCFIAAAERNGTVYIATLFHGDMPPNNASQKKKDNYSIVRYNDARALIEYAFENDLRTLSAADLIARGLPTSLQKEHDPDVEDILSSTYTVEWDPKATFSAPVFQFPQALLSDPLNEELIHTEWSQIPVEEDAIVGRMTVSIDDVVYFEAPIRCTAVERPTPAPTATPTPIPTATPTPEPAIEIVSVPAVTESPVASPAPTAAPWWLSCAPKGY